MSDWFLLLAALACSGFGILSYVQMKRRLTGSIPESLYPQFERLEAAAPFHISAQGTQTWKESGGKITVNCKLVQRKAPHHPALEIEGQFEKSAESPERSGEVSAKLAKSVVNLYLLGPIVKFEGLDGLLASLDLHSGELSRDNRLIGLWNQKKTYQGPGESVYNLVQLHGEEFYLCTHSGAIKIPGEKVYSPLIAGETATLVPPDKLLLIGLGALWHGVLNNA